MFGNGTQTHLTEDGLVSLSLAHDRSQTAGGKRQRMLDNLANVILKTLVQHPVGLVEHQPADARQHERAFVGEIENTTGCADNNSRAFLLQLTLLVVFRYATVDADAGDRRECRGAGGEVGMRLHGQLTSRCDDEDGDGVLGRVGV